MDTKKIIKFLNILTTETSAGNISWKRSKKSAYNPSKSFYTQLSNMNVGLLKQDGWDDDNTPLVEIEYDAEIPATNIEIDDEEYWRDIIEVQRVNTQNVIESKKEQGGVCHAQI